MRSTDFHPSMIHPNRTKPALFLISSLFALTLLAPPTLAQPTGKGVGRSGTSLEIRVGWGGAVQAGRWHPVYITLSHPVSRSVTFDFRAPHGSYFGMRSRQVMTIGPQPQTFIVYMPLRHFMPEDLSFVIRDAATRRLLASYPAGPYVSFAPTEHTSPGHSFLGIS